MSCEEEVISDQVSRQVARQIGSSIANHIAGNIDNRFSSFSNAGGAGDSSSSGPDSLWSTFSWSRLSNDGGAVSAFDTDIYQTTSGIDKKFGNFYVGASLVYAATVTDFTGSLHDDKHSVSITPYAAYVFNKNFFISALSGYVYTNSDPSFAQQTNTHANISEVDLNALEVIDNWFMKGKVGGRYLHNHDRTDAVPGLSATVNNTDSWTFLTEATGGYSFNNGVKAFTGILYEYNDQGSSLSLPTRTSLNPSSSVFYYNAGLDYSVTKAFTFGANVQTDLSNPTIDLTTLAINARLALYTSPGHACGFFK